MEFDREAYLRAPLEHEAQLLSHLHPSAVRVVLDIGACEGADSIKYARLFPSAVVHAFEPVETNVAIARASIAREGLEQRVHVHAHALGATEGPQTLFVSSGQPPSHARSDWDFGNKSSSLYPPGRTRDVHPWLKFEQTTEIMVRRLAGVLPSLGIDAVDLIHLDVQGAELDVLIGTGQLLGRVTAIWLEVERIQLYAGQPTAPEVVSFLRRAGFRLVHDTVNSVSGDQLWIRRHARRRRSWSVPRGARHRLGGPQ